MTVAALIKPILWRKPKSRKLIHELKELGVHIVTASTPEHIAAELLELGDSGRLIAVGGDGTVHLALNSLPNTSWELAVIPYGTGNDFARHLGLKQHQSALQIALNESAQPIDVGLITLADGSSRKFIGVTSCGFDALVNERANQLRGPAGTLKYLAAVFIELANLRPLSLSVTTKTKTLDADFSLIAVGNCPTYGGGMRICPAALPTDGQFAVTYVAPAKRRTLVRVLPSVFWAGHLKHRLVSTEETAAIAIAGNAFLIYADGEYVGVGPAQIEVQPGAVQIVRPTVK